MFRVTNQYIYCYKLNNELTKLCLPLETFSGQLYKQRSKVKYSHLQALVTPVAT